MKNIYTMFFVTISMKVFDLEFFEFHQGYTEIKLIELKLCTLYSTYT